MMTFPTPNNHCANVPPPASLSYFTASMSVLLAIITIPGNFLVCLAIIKDPFRNLKTPFNYFLLSLASTDLAVGAILDLIVVAYHIDEALKLKVVDITVLHMFYFILSTASILTLAALTMDRYFVVASPKYKTMVTSKRAILASVSIWIGALGFSFIYLKLGFIDYSFVFANTAVFTTFLVLIFVHAGILKRLRERSKYWRDQREVNYAESGMKYMNDFHCVKKAGFFLLCNKLTTMESRIFDKNLNYLVSFYYAFCSCRHVATGAFYLVDLKDFNEFLTIGTTGK